MNLSELSRFLFAISSCTAPLTLWTGCVLFLTVVPHLRFGQATKSVGCRKPTEFIQEPSQQKTPEALLPESRRTPPVCPLSSGDSKRAEFSVELMVCNVQPTQLS